MWHVLVAEKIRKIKIQNDKKPEFTARKKYIKFPTFQDMASKDLSFKKISEWKKSPYETPKFIGKKNLVLFSQSAGRSI